MTRYSNPFSFYRDPHADERALAALVDRGRPPAGPSDEQRSTALAALVRAAQPAPEPGPDPRAEALAADRSRAAGALLAARPPEPEPELVAQPDPAAIEAERRSLGASALARAFTPPAPPPAPEPGPDPELERLSTASAANALANAFKPPPPPKPRAPVPASMRDRVPAPDMEISLAESDRALGTTPEPDPIELNPYYGSARSSAARKPDMDLSDDPDALALTGGRKPDMDLSEDQRAWNLTSNRNPVAKREMVAELDAMQAGHEGRDPLPGMKLSADPNAPSKPSAPRDPVQQAIRVAAEEAEETPAEQKSEGSETKEHADAATPAAPQRAQAPREDDDPGPQLNGWLLAADVLNNGGRGIAGMIAAHQKDVQQWKARRDGLAEREYQHGRDAKSDEFRKRQFAAQDAERKTVNARADRAADMNEWHLTDASQQGWEAKENERKRYEALDAERKADNARADRGMSETERHNRAMEAASGANAREARAAREHSRELLHGAVPGIEILDQGAWDSATTTEGARAKAIEVRSSLGSAVEALQEMKDIRARIGIGNPQTNAADITRYEQAKKRYIGALGAAAGSGVLQPSEYKTYAEGIPDVTGGLRDVGDRIYNRFADKPQDTALEKLTGALDDMTTLTNARLGMYGGRYSPIVKPNSDAGIQTTTKQPAPTDDPADGEDIGPEDESKPFKQVMIMPDGKERSVTFEDQDAFDEFMDHFKGAMPKGARP